MIAPTISRARLRDLARLGRFGPVAAGGAGLHGACASPRTGQLAPRGRRSRGIDHLAVLLQRARRPRRSARLHAAVRPRARGGPRARRRRGRAADLALPLRRAAGGGRLPAHGLALPGLVARLPALAAAAAGEGRGAPARPACARAAVARRPARAVARLAAGRPAAPLPGAVGLHGARSRAAADGVAAGSVADA